MVREVSFLVNGGQLSAIDHGGVGRPVVLVHAPGFNALDWGAVIAGVEGRVVSVDLRGHGRSRAPIVPGDQLWQDLVTVVDGLQLQRPVLVALGMSGAIALQAATHAPGGFAALVLINGSCATSPERMQQEFALLDNAHPGEMLGDRFALGRLGDPPDRAAFAEHALQKLRGDWWVPGEHLTLDLIERNIVDHDDGSFTLAPTPEAVRACFVYEPGPAFPSIRLYDDLDLPIWLIGSPDGFDPAGPDEVQQLASRKATVQARVLPGGQYLQHTAPRDVIDTISLALLDLDGVPADEHDIRC
ncbi:pimeloyl-ACP methyl ester carboxylesterase [Kineosphaera limosa]|uniref:AB hydrolase-1 domain-containing protein n=1 Tax=Kineosphaera limosa NBRC 100340 TaxID=1184609 RepID=K6XF76_9MICO|nr:alpha/beta hydrolase [Kineosphaera limosa]NYD99836.1 pimeloyl-ACP methyl ester carboxylesterase [Kineosphaera limosa]GAB97489.1 hypothetical protein KILIM_070_00260 [Kineosphaera limosa NBRC 100340]